MSAGTPTLIKESPSYSEGTWTGTRVYQVPVTSLDDDALTAYAAGPAIGAAWSTGMGGLKAIGKSVDNFDGDQLTYEVTVQYSSKKDDQDKSIENPLDRPTQYSYQDSTTTESYFRDRSSTPKPVTNSAGELFTTLPQRERAVGTFTVTRNVAAFNDATAQGYRDKINASAVTINSVSYPARTLRVVGWSASGPNVENDTTFWTETITIAKNADTWDDTPEDRGLNELDSGKLKPILDSKHEPVVSPWPLDGSGAAKANATDTPEQLTFKPYDDGSFPTL